MSCCCRVTKQETWNDMEEMKYLLCAMECCKCPRIPPPITCSVVLPPRIEECPAFIPPERPCCPPPPCCPPIPPCCPPPPALLPGPCCLPSCPPPPPQCPPKPSCPPCPMPCYPIKYC